MEQRKRESQIPKGTFGVQSVVEDASLRGDLSGTFIRPVSEAPPAPIAKIELRRQVALPPPPPVASLRSILPPPPPPSAVSLLGAEPSLRALVAPSYPLPASIATAPAEERVEFPDYSLRLDIQPMAPPPASLLPMPGDERPRSRKLVVFAGLAVVVGGFLVYGFMTASSPRVMPPVAKKAVSAPVAPVVNAVAATVVVPEAVVEANPAPVVAAVVAPAIPVITKAKALTPVAEAAPVVAEPVAVVPVAAEPVVDSPDSEEHAPSLEAALVEEIPETLERAEVIEGIEILRNEYEACAGELHGMAELKITIANTGRISHALVGGDFAGTPQGSCLARTLRQARFRSFQQPRLDIAYPLSL